MTMIVFLVALIFYFRVKSSTLFIGTLLPLYHSFILGCFAAYPLWHCSHLLCFATKNEKSNTLVPLPHLRKSAIKGIVYEIAIVSISDLLSD